MGGGEVLKKGWLIKSPPLDSGGMKAWRRRFFCLRSSKVLEYFKSVDGDLKGVVNLEDCKAVHADLSHKKYKFVFDIETRDRTYYLVASSHEEMREWVDTICSVCSFSLQNIPVGDSSPSVGDSSKTLPPKMPGGQPLITPPTSANSTGSGISFNERFKPVENGATAESLYSLASDAGAEVKRQLKGGSEVPAGIPLTEALASKGLGNGGGRQRTESGSFIYQSYQPTGLAEYNYFSPRPTGANDPQGIYSLAQESHTKARAATMMPGFQLDDKKLSQPAAGAHRQLHVTSSLGGSALDAGLGGGRGQGSSTSAGPTVSSAMAISSRTETNRAELMENGYMAPRRIPRPAAYDYPPFGPPRPADPSAGGAVVSGTPPRQPPHSALLKPQDSPPIPSSTSPPSSSAAGGVGCSPTYINLQKMNDDLPPPPIDRTTKPTPPAIDRALKPGSSSVPKSTPPNDSGGFDKDDDDEDSDSDSSGSSPELGKRPVFSQVPFSVADLPKPTNRTTQYTQVEFDKTTRRPKLPDDDISKRAPVPVPRDRDHPVPKPRRVNYSDIDLSATAARVETTRTSSRSPTLRQAEHQHLKDTPYINVNREGDIDDDTDPDYYTHMRDLTEDDVDRPSMEVLKEFIPPRS